MPKQQFITTPIYYVNGSPHIGHAYTTVAADVHKRFLLQNNQRAYLLTGTDEHGVKIAQSAQKNGETPIGLANRIAKEFKSAWELLNIDFDQFIRTTNSQHEKIVSEVLTKIKENGYIYAGIYEGLYCIGCEEYKKEADLVEGMCLVHKTKPELIKEDIWFFKLSCFQDKIIDLIESDKLNIYPLTRLNETLSFLKSGLEDIAISRSKVGWGIPLPWDKSQTIYVWVEALLNYYSATIIDNKPDLFPPDIQFVGKDILRFHAVIWPALLLAMDEEKLPKTIAVHGFFTINNEKMSKSLGNVIAPRDLIDLFGVDATRYLLLSQFPFGNDGDFSIDKLKDHYTADLVNGLGNLVQRVLTVAKKLELKIGLEEVAKRSKIDNFNFYENIQLIKKKIDESNRFVSEKKPWEFEPGSDEARVVIGHLVAQINELAFAIEPFMPETSGKIIHQLETGNPEILFPRLVK